MWPLWWHLKYTNSPCLGHLTQFPRVWPCKAFTPTAKLPKTSQKPYFFSVGSWFLEVLVLLLPCISCTYWSYWHGVPFWASPHFQSIWPCFLDHPDFLVGGPWYWATEPLGWYFLIQHLLFVADYTSTVHQWFSFPLVLLMLLPLRKALVSLVSWGCCHDEFLCKPLLELFPILLKIIC